MKVLALDGGGVFGFAQARILSESEAADKFDVYVGTSIGSAIAAACALDEEELVGQAFFDTWMPRIFNASIWRKLNPFTTKYPDVELNRALVTLFRDRTLNDVRKPLFVTAANIVDKRLKVFSSLDSDASTRYIRDIIRSATAGETYFTPKDGYSDGGVFANNPSMVAVAAVSKVFEVPLDQIELMSIGTGLSVDQWHNDGPTTSLGWLWWLVEASLQGSASSMHEYFTSCLPLKKYERIQFVRRPGWGLDNVAGMKLAERDWDKAITQGIDAIKAF